MTARSAEAGLCFVTELYYPEETSTGYFLTGIAEGLAHCFPVSVLCSQPTYRARGSTAPRSEVRNGVRILRCASTALNKDVLPFRLLNALTFTLATAVAALRRVRRGDVVITVTNPPLLPPLMAAVCRIRGARSIVLVHDVYPDVLVASGLARSGSALVRLLTSLYRATFEAAEAIVVLGEDMRSRLSGRAPADGLVVIPNWGDVDVITPRERSANGLLQRLDIGDAFVVQYLGNMGWTHDPAVLLQAAARTGPGVQYVFVGSGRQYAFLADQVQADGLRNVHVLPGCSAAELCDYLNACDVAVIAMKPGMSGVSVPSRVYNILAAGKPLLAVCDDDSEPARIVRRHACGWVVSPANVPGLIGAIEQARTGPERLARMSANARRAAVEFYTREHAIAAYENMLEPLLTQERAASSSGK